MHKSKNAAGQQDQAAAPAGKCPDWMQVMSDWTAIPPGRHKSLMRELGHSPNGAVPITGEHKNQAEGRPGWIRKCQLAANLSA